MDFTAFTLKAKGRLNRIVTEILVVEAYDPLNPPNPRPTGIKTTALWDTGATGSVISSELAKVLKLTAAGKRNVSHAGGVSTSPTYLVNFELPHGVSVAGILACEFQAAPNSFGAIVGMDVISHGDLSITNVKGETWVSFRTPSVAAIDYVVEANKLRFAGTQRNDPCPCGSGKKYKKCHGA